MIRTFKAVVGGVEYDIPTSMNILRAAEVASGILLPEAMVNGINVAFVQGVLYAGIKRVDDAVTFEEIGERCTFPETQDAYLAFIQALAPELPDASKNGTTEEIDISIGQRSKDTDTDSSN